jgi:hypothetical protein
LGSALPRGTQCGSIATLVSRRYEMTQVELHIRHGEVGATLASPFIGVPCSLWRIDLDEFFSSFAKTSLRTISAIRCGE